MQELRPVGVLGGRPRPRSWPGFGPVRRDAAPSRPLAGQSSSVGVNLTAQVAAPAALEEPNVGVVGQIRAVLLVEGTRGADRGTDELAGQHPSARPVIVQL